MAAWSTPYEGRDNIIIPAVYVSGALDLRVYTNTQDSLDASTTLSDLSYPTGTGYAIVTLSGSWSASNGVATYDHGAVDNVVWTAGSDWTGGDCTGIAMTDGSVILHFKDFDLGPKTMTTGQIIEVDISSIAGF